MSSIGWESTTMNETHSAELYRHEGPEKQLVTVSVGPDGVDLGALDSGPLVQRTWGRDYYEYWVDVSAGEIHNLLLALLRERYAGRNDAVAEFRAFCEKNESNTSGIAGHSGTGYSNGAQKNASTGNPSSIGSYFQ
jgi:hypothetical protein